MTEIDPDKQEHDLTEEDREKREIRLMAKHSTQVNLSTVTMQRAKNTDNNLKRKKSKSDFDREKRELEKLTWRDDHCDNPSAA